MLFPHIAAGVRVGDVLPEAEIVGRCDLRVASCAADSRQCRPGDLFVALRGTRVDGHGYTVEAIRRGAVAVVVDRPVTGVSGLGVPVVYVPDTRSAYGRLCQALAGWPGRRLKSIGVTGTNGKTATAQLIAGVLESGDLMPGAVGAVDSEAASYAQVAQWAVPAPPVFAERLARMVSAGCTHAVAEVSSRALDQARLAGVDLDVAVVTNVACDHLDYHRTLANYRAAKARIFEFLSPSGLAVLNVDDQVCRDFVRRLDGAVLTVGIDSEADLTATPIEQCVSEQTFLLHAGSESVPVRTTLIGRHNIYNCLQAAAVGLGYGLSLAAVVRGLETLKYVPGRLERIECGQPFGVFVDVAHTPAALEAVLRSLREIATGRVVCVLGCGGEGDRRLRPLLGGIAETLADEIVVTSDRPRSESAAVMAREVLRGCVDPGAARVVLDRAAAIRWALASAGSGDVVLIAGRGHEVKQYADSEEVWWDDRELVCEWLYDQAARNAWQPVAA